MPEPQFLKTQVISLHAGCYISSFSFFYFSPFFLKAKDLSSEHFINGEGAILQLKITQFFLQDLK